MSLKRWFSVFVFCIASSLFAEPLPFVIRSVPVTEKVVALTIDDGPSLSVTPKVLSVLDNYNVKATFFLVGKQVVQHSNIAVSIYDKGHVIGNHGYEHIRIESLDSKSVLKSIAKSQVIFYETLGLFPQFFRPPFGRLKDSQLQVFDTHFKHVVRWSIDPQAWNKSNSNREVIRHVISALKPGRIIVLHENKRLPSLLPGLIKAIRKQGYRCVGLDTLIQKKP